MRAMLIAWRRFGWMAPALALLTAVTTLIFGVIRRDIWPVYESSVEVLVQPENATLVDAARVLLSSYQGWLDSNQRALAVIDRLDLDSHPDDLMDAIEFETDDQRLVITITSEGRSPELGEQIVTEWANLFIEWREEENKDTLAEEGRIDAMRIDDARSELVLPRVWLNTAVGAILGGITGLGLAYLADEMSAGVIRDAEDIAGLGLPPVVVIPTGPEKEG